MSEIVRKHFIRINKCILTKPFQLAPYIAPVKRLCEDALVNPNKVFQMCIRDRAGIIRLFFLILRGSMGKYELCLLYTSRCV